MKKIGILVGLAMVSTLSFAQFSPSHHHTTPVLYTPIGENTATVDQTGNWLIGVVYQKGDNNTATINQAYGTADVSYKNTAVISQVGFSNEGTINQWNEYNYAYLVQGTENEPVTGAKGTITQTGAFNVAAIRQYSNSFVNLEQSGNYNAVLGLSSNEAVNFCHPGVPTPYTYSCNPTYNYNPLIVGEGQDLGTITQSGDGNYFYGIGVLKGQRTITQTGDWAESSSYHHHHSDVDRDNNYIFLQQEGGTVDLTQNGHQNKIWLDVKVVNDGNPNVSITQNGYKNLVARFSSPCGNCGSAVGPAIFEGDNMVITQTGWKNKVSVDSQSIHSNVYVSQDGTMNTAMIVQRDFAATPISNIGCHHCH